jgi:cytidine deaminase
MVHRLNFAHHGTIAIGDRNFLWKEKDGGEIILKEDKDQEFHRFGDFLAGTPNKAASTPAASDMEIHIINKLLAHYRQNALPDENGYYAASAGIDSNGRLFVAVNNETVIKHAFAGRGCAETTMLRHCQEAVGKADVELSKVYLMSGRAKKMPNGGLKEEGAGSWSCLCGECRQNLRAHTKNADFIILPTNDGSKTLKLSEALSPSNLKPFNAWKIPHNQLYPLPEYRELDSLLSRHVWDGYEAVTLDKAPIPAFSTELPVDISQLTPELYTKLRNAYERADTAIPALADNPSFTNINRALVQLVKQAYAKHKKSNGVLPNIEITAVLVKTDKGEFYPSVLVNGELWLPSKPPEIPTALSNAYNQVGISEVYTMTFDNYQLQNERSDAQSGEGVKHRIKMPDPAGLGRLLKNAGKGKSPLLRVIPINNGMLDEQLLRAISEPLIDVSQAFGPGYSSNKQQIASGRGA